MGGAAGCFLPCFVLIRIANVPGESRQVLPQPYYSQPSVSLCQYPNIPIAYSRRRPGRPAPSAGFGVIESTEGEAGTGSHVDSNSSQRFGHP